MPLVHWMAVAALAISPFTAPFTVAAQTKDLAPDPADPRAQVAAFVHESAFNTYQFAAGQDASPDKTWRAANDEVQGLGGHMGHAQDAGDVRSQPSSGPASAHHGMKHGQEGK